MRGLFVAFTFAVAALILVTDNIARSDVKSGGKYAPQYTEVVRVIKNPDQTITFEYCEGENLTECRTLGNKPSYKLRDLEREEYILKKQRDGMVISDAGYLVASAVAGAITSLATPTPVGPVAVALFAASGAAGGAAFILKSFLDPGQDGARAKIKAPRTLSEHILNGESVWVNMPINEFAQQLDTTLKQIF